MNQVNDFILKSKRDIVNNISLNVERGVLEKSSIPSNLVIDFKKDFQKMTSKLFNLQALLEHCHRSTKSEPHHEALGEAYESFGEIKDDIIEFTMGDTEHDYGSLTIDDLPEYEPEMAFLSSDLIMQLGIEIQSFSKKYNIPSVENKSQELHGVGAKLKYKLNMIESDEN